MMDSSCTERAGARARLTRLVRFSAVGASGVVVNLAVLHLLAAGAGLPELWASAAAIEASILSNFALNDRFTFRDARGAGLLGRLGRWHLVCAGGMALQLATFAFAAGLAARLTGSAELGALRYVAQLCGIAVGFAWNWSASVRWAWSPPGAQARPAPVAWRVSLRQRLPVLLFAALTAVLVLPIWLVAYVPTQDGPLHVENVLAIAQYHASPLLQRWYLANWGAQPNWLTQALLAPLLQVLSPVAAEKAVLTGYTVLLPLAFRMVLPRGRRGWWGALAVFPFVQAYPYHMGFWNFCWGLALAFAAAGLWLRRRGRLGPGRGLALAVLSVLLYLAHSVAFAGALVAAGSVLLFRAVLALRRARGSAARRRLVLRGYGLRVAGGLAAAAPGILLLGAWLLAHRDRVSARIPFTELAAKLVTGYALVSIDRAEIFLAVAVMLVLFVAVVHLVLARAGRGPRLRPHDGWLLAALAFVVLYFAVPDVVAAGAHVSDRLALFAFLCVGAWIGAGLVPAASLRRTALALGALAVVATGVRLEKQLRLSSLMEEYVTAAEVVPEGSVLLPLALQPHGPRDANGRRMGYRIKPFLHAGSWIVAERGGIDLKNSQANTDHCPVKWPPDRNPFLTIATSLGRMEGSPPCVDLRALPRLGRVDYVLVWGATRENLETPCGAALAAELATRYEPVYLSAPRGMLGVWKPREVTAGR